MGLSEMTFGDLVRELGRLGKAQKDLGEKTSAVIKELGKHYSARGRAGGTHREGGVRHGKV